MNYLRSLKVFIPEEVQYLFPCHETLRLGIAYERSGDGFSGTVTLNLVPPHGSGRYEPVASFPVAFDDNRGFSAAAKRIATDRRLLIAALLSATPAA